MEIKATSETNIVPIRVLPNKQALARLVANFVNVLAYAIAVTLAGIAAYFSIRGFVVLFPGAPTAIVIMGAAMEGGKLATVAWLARHWRASTWTVRTVLAGLILPIAAINAAGGCCHIAPPPVGCV